MRKLAILLFHFQLLAMAASSIADEPDVSPRIVAHRGLLRHAPENTLANFRACLELRLGFELDVRRCKDGELVCVHDATVDRTTSGSGRVSDLTLAELKTLDAGSWFAAAFQGEQIPTLDAVLKAVSANEHDVLIALDLKAANVENDCVKLAIEHDVLNRVLFIGRAISMPAVRQVLKAADPKAPTAAVANNAGD